MKLIIGIDDTDNRYSRGTGHRAREMAALLEKKGLAKIQDITRHQLLVDPKIPYTSHNSSASIVCERLKGTGDVISSCRNYLKKKSAIGSDAGLCVANWNTVDGELSGWGKRAKMEILKLNKALEIARRNQVYLEGLRGKKIGVIGALAAVGLRKEGCDGRLLWMKHLRELNGIFNVKELYNLLKIDKIAQKNGDPVPAENMIFVDNWCRPVHVNGQITLFAEEDNEHEQYQWRIASKEFIKSISE